MADWLNTDRAFKASAMGSALFEGFCKVFFSAYCPLTVEGREHLPAGSFLLCSNHNSHADSAALMTATGRAFDSFALLGASDYFFDRRSVRWCVSPLLNVIPIDRRARPKSMASCLAICERFVVKTGGSLILYPEGTRSPNGEMQMFRDGAGLFAIRLGLPVVPAYIEGTSHILPKGQSIPRIGPITVRFGEALRLTTFPWSEGAARNRRRNAVAKITQSVMELSRSSQSESC